MLEYWKHSILSVMLSNITAIPTVFMLLQALTRCYVGYTKQCRQDAKLLAILVDEADGKRLFDDPEFTYSVATSEYTHVVLATTMYALLQQLAIRVP